MTDDEYAEYLDQAEKIELPKFIEIPPAPAQVTLQASETSGIWKVSIDGGRSDGRVFDSPEEAYDFVSKEEPDVDILLDASLKSGGWGNLHGGMYFSHQANDHGTFRLLIEGGHQSHLSYLKRSFYDHLLLTKRYREAPEDWALAYHWLDGHPMFWTNKRETKDLLSWSTEYGMSDAWQTVGSNKDGTPYVMLESGPHTEDFRQRSLDHRLDAIGSSFEEAYVRFARKVDKYYDESGEERIFDGDDRETHGLPPEVFESVKQYEERVQND